MLKAEKYSRKQKVWIQEYVLDTKLYEVKR